MGPGSLRSAPPRASGRDDEAEGASPRVIGGMTKLRGRFAPAMPWNDEAEGCGAFTNTTGDWPRHPTAVTARVCGS